MLMLDAFLNPGYLAAGIALVSVPILIHLINRLRFKRLRWAAMEFLLKSQKRNRRRLIIEQLLLLALRCLLVLLTALLVLRFVGLSLADFRSQETIHLVLLDDSPSMADRWKEGGMERTSFGVAKEEVLQNSLVKTLAQSSAAEKLLILPLSRLAAEADYQPPLFQKLNDAVNEKKVQEFLDSLQPSYVHVSLAAGVQRARQLFANYPGARHVLHLVSDFRRVDWSDGPEAETLHKTLQQLVQDKVLLRAVDVAHPYRARGQSGVPLSHDNVALVDLRANTRVVGKGMPVTFTVEVANYGAREETVHVVIYDDATGKEMPQIDFNPPMPLRVPPDKSVTATFELRLYPDIPAGQRFALQRLSARLESAQRGPLESDGLMLDNVRYAAVEVRNKVPVLILDGQGPAGRKEEGDSFFIEKALQAVPGGSYEVVYGDQLVGGKEAVLALEQADLSPYPTIFLLNIPKLNEAQRQRLESFVAQGGGVAFFLGPRVQASYYNRELYRNGQGLFPVPLAETYFPPPSEPPRDTPFTGDFQLRVRYDRYGETADALHQVPIFGSIFPEMKQLEFLKDLPIRRYFPAPRSAWKAEPGRVFELAALPNEQPVTNYQSAILALLERLPRNDPRYQAYAPGLERHSQELRQIVAPGSELKAYHLAEALQRLLQDRGRKDDPRRYPNLTELWNRSDDPKLLSLRQDIEALRDQLLYGDPFIVAQRFGKGQVVAVLSTAGKEWNDWGGGCGASVIYQPFIWEMQNWLSRQTEESALLVGMPVTLEVSLARLKAEGNERVQMVRTYYKPQPNQPALEIREAPTFGVAKQGVLVFTYPHTLEPGFYLAQLVLQGQPATAPPLAAWGQTFNIDARHEGKLRRIAEEEFQQAVGSSELHLEPPPQGVVPELVQRQNDLSESAWFFLLFLAVLVTEQALAVHLSFHLRGEGQLPLPAVSGPSRAAA
jgi:hypothetical protein